MRLRPLGRNEGPALPTRRQAVAFLGYSASAGIYIGIGLYTVDFLLSFWVAVAYVLVTMWAVPATVRRFVR